MPGVSDTKIRKIKPLPLKGPQTRKIARLQHQAEYFRERFAQRWARAVRSQSNSTLQGSGAWVWSASSSWLELSRGSRSIIMEGPFEKENWQMQIQVMQVGASLPLSWPTHRFRRLHCKAFHFLFFWWCISSNFSDGEKNSTENRQLAAAITTLLDWGVAERQGEKKVNLRGWARSDGAASGNRNMVKRGKVIQTRDLAHALTKQTKWQKKNWKEGKRTSDQRKLDKSKIRKDKQEFRSRQEVELSSKPQNNQKKQTVEDWEQELEVSPSAGYQSTAGTWLGKDYRYIW